jgi:HK97 family phage major capsid protein
MSLSLAAWVVPYSAIWLGKAMVSTVTTGSKIAVQGDFRYFVIVDRIGMDIDRVQSVGGSLRPTGQRVIYCFWRNTSKVLDPAV